MIRMRLLDAADVVNGEAQGCRAQKLYRRLLGCPLVDNLRDFRVIE